MNTISSGGIAVATPFDQQITTLIERFETDMRSMEHVPLTRSARSAGWRQLLMRGKEAIGPIVIRLESDVYQSARDLDEAWKNFLRELAGQEKIPGVPSSSADLQVFIDWAKKQTVVV